ncbi:uncharacterized protein N7459_000841 [Penicillium hispanicum]|uniref:uncharacterized protein n=1 Tax=Penicillium hispanicum TaxID=1080232 RepID=UPI0025415DD4|nr:uncharacterized protein N7459_000841 [Penicillium hispanicum]KAJ5594633.1 hypothetical protein N7459_000841 [Penicillium hispanicum]
MRWSELNPEIWYLVFQAVSTAFNALATPVLYRSVILRRSETTGQEWNVLPGDTSDSDEADNLRDSLFSRLLDHQNESLRTLVRELTLDRIVRADEMIAQRGNPIVKLVNGLPNLERVYFRDEYPLSQVLIDAMRGHKRSPQLHILNPLGRIQLAVPAPFVKALSTSVNVYARGTGSQKQTLDLRRLFTIYPNLESLSVSINRYRTGCVRRHPRDYTTEIIPLELPGSETFPPLQSLSLSGYYCEEQEFQYWRDKFPWDRLESLSLGPEDNYGFLEQITGYVHRLKNLKVTAYCHRTETTSPQLDHFLGSFDTLESLTAKGFVPSVEAVGHHPNLKTLCLHAIEHPERDRPVPSAQLIQKLDQYCPNLQSLAIDVQQEDTWVSDVRYKPSYCARAHLYPLARRLCSCSGDWV